MAFGFKFIALNRFGLLPERFLDFMRAFLMTG
jgi:hypothetical protein